MRKGILKVYIWLMAIAVGYGIWYGLTGLGLPCYYLSVRGYECPGCGLSRMIFCVLQLRFRQGFLYNPVGFVAFFVWNAVAALCWWGKLKMVKKPIFTNSLLALTIAAFLVQGLLRNLY